jgi:Mg-chelatase subunit ChlD
MPKRCSRPECGQPNPDVAVYCQYCGFALGAVDDNGRTMVAPSDCPPMHVSKATIHEVTHRLEGVFPHGIAIDNTLQDARLGQRELTVCVVDRSWSMEQRDSNGRSRLEWVVMANIQMLATKEAIDPDDEAALVAFNSQAELVLPMQPIRSHKTKFMRALQSLQPANGTDINQGLKTAQKAFDWARQDAVRRIMLLTDGQGGDPLRTATDLKSRGVVIDVVGVGESPSRVNEKVLRAVASVVEGEVRYRFIKDMGTLVTHYQGMAQKTAIGG